LCLLFHVSNSTTSIIPSNLLIDTLFTGNVIEEHR
jgi:hypothetical protein